MIAKIVVTGTIVVLLGSCGQYSALLGQDNRDIPSGYHNVRVDNSSTSTISISVHSESTVVDTDNTTIVPGETGRILLDIDDEQWVAVLIEDTTSDASLVLANRPEDFFEDTPMPPDIWAPEITTVNNWYIEFFNF